MLNNLGSPEIILIAVIALWFFGDKKLKVFAKRLGESTKELKKFKEQLGEEGEKPEEDKPTEA